MLHGIGGRTIAEAKERLSYDEALDWFAYIRKRGSLNWGMRLEGGFALIANFIANKVSGYSMKGDPVGVMKKRGGGSFHMVDFMPHADELPVESIDDKLMKVLGVKKT